jgi:hypothetical protein
MTASPFALRVVIHAMGRGMTVAEALCSHCPHCYLLMALYKGANLLANSRREAQIHGNNSPVTGVPLAIASFENTPVKMIFATALISPRRAG